MEFLRKFEMRNNKPITASGDYCHLLITFANTLDLDKDRQNVSPDLDINRLHSDNVPEGFLLEKLILKKKSADDYYPACMELNRKE